MISIIVAITRDGAIGKDGDQMYYIAGDLKRFRELTTGNTVVMGRRTFEALPKGALPNRKNIVVTRNGEYKADRATVVTTPEEAITLAEGEAFIIGGAQIYRSFIDSADRIYLTVIEAERPDADTFFPPIDSKKWKVTEKGELLHDDKTNVDYRYITLTRCEV